jgi:DNA invertase Pin-like site-specific DNA recombinase
MIAYSYTRISAPEQELGDGPHRQGVGIIAYCKAKGLTLDATPLSDLGLSGFSGANMDKGALGQFRDAVMAKSIELPCALIVEDLDRISRREPEYANTDFYGLIKAGVEIHTTIDKQVYKKGKITTPLSFYIAMKFGRGHDESKTKSDRHNSNWSKKKADARDFKKPMTRMVPEWLRVDKKREKFIVIAERAKIVRRIFREAAEGSGKLAIAGRINAEGIATWGKGGRQGVRWHYSYVNKILNNRSVLGEMQMYRKIEGIRVPDGDVIRDFYPVVISEAAWEAAHKSMKTRSVRFDANPDAPKNLVPQLVYINGHRALWVDKGGKKTSDGKRGMKKASPHGGRWIYYQTKEPATGKTLDIIPALAIEEMILTAMVRADGNNWVNLLQQAAPPIDPKITIRRRLEDEIRRRKEGIARLLIVLKLGRGGAESIAEEIDIEERSRDAAQEKLKELGPEITTNEHIAPQIDELRQLAESGDTSSQEIRDAMKRKLLSLFARIDIGKTPALMMEHLKKIGSNCPHVIAPGMLDNPPADGPDDKTMLWAMLTLKDSTGLARMMVTSHAPTPEIHALLKYKQANPLFKPVENSNGKK